MKNVYKYKQKNGIDSGFTLAEMAVVLVMFGLLMTAALHLYKVNTINLDYERTREHIRLAQDAVKEFYGLFGRYPCPANPSLTPGDANYGLQQCRANPTAACPAGIVCTTVGSRNADDTGGNDPVMIGALPIMTLVNNNNRLVPIEAIHGTDGFGMKLSYAVTELMTDQTASIVNPVNPHLGAISVRDENNINLTDPDSSAHFVIYSQGLNKIGATPVRSGNIVEACTYDSVAVPGDPPAPGSNIGAAGIPTDRENCDRNDAIFVSGLRSLADTDDYYDDVLFFTASATFPLWMTSLNSPVGVSWIYNTNLGFVGVGTDVPDKTLHASGKIRAEDSIQTDQGFCNYTRLPSGSGTPDNCLLPSFIASNPSIASGKTCPAGQVAKGIENNRLVCEDLLSGPVNFTCPSGPPQQYLKGFTVDSAGGVTPICEAVPP